MKWFSDKRRVRRVDPINFVGNLMTPDFGTMWKISLLNSLGSLPIVYIVYRNTWLNRKRADSRLDLHFEVEPKRTLKSIQTGE